MKVFVGVALITLAACFAFARAQVPVCEPGVDYYPHPTNCSLYYHCSQGVPIEQECAPPLYWNAAAGICDFPLSSGCENTVQTTTERTTSTEPATTTEPTKTTQVSTTTGLPTEVPTTTGLPTEGPTTTGLPTEGPTTTGLPTEGTTTSGFPTEGTTTSGFPTEGTTTSGFPTEVTTTSDIPTEGSSTSGIPTEGTSSVPTEGTSSVPTEGSSSSVPTEEPPTESSSTTTSSPQPSTEPPGGLPNACPPVDDPDNIVRLPHETNCEYYYRCSNGGRTLFACANDDSLHFSPTLRVCQPAGVAGCDRCPAVDDANHVVRLPHETDCHLYYLCQEGGRELFQCREDWHFSRDVRDCFRQEEAKCRL